MKIFSVIWLFVFISFSGCSKNDESIPKSEPKKSLKNYEDSEIKKTEQKADSDYESDEDELTDENYHTDPNYKYEYRTGSSSNYEYNYDVRGSDENGNSVSGNIDIDGKYGTGTIEDENGNEKELDVEWIDYGKLEGTDEDGNTYDLEVDD